MFCEFSSITPPGCAGYIPPMWQQKSGTVRLILIKKLLTVRLNCDIVKVR